MKSLQRADLLSLEDYEQQRPAFRQRVMAEKNRRRVSLSKHLTVLFENRLSVQYQVQEMLRAERIFDPAGIAAELDTYNPLIPDGTNLKATLLIEYTDVAQRRRALAELVGIEHKIWLQVAELPRVFAIADEDLPRANEEKTSAVHFLRFELTQAMRRAMHARDAIAMGVDHPACPCLICALDPPLARALSEDFEPVLLTEGADQDRIQFSNFSPSIR